MTKCVLSPKFQVVIPKKIRNQLRLKPGQCLEVAAKGTHVELRPVPGPDELIGMLKGDRPLEFYREGDRDLSAVSTK